jgi:hypothetical protein
MRSWRLLAGEEFRGVEGRQLVGVDARYNPGLAALLTIFADTRILLRDRANGYSPFSSGVLRRFSYGGVNRRPVSVRHPDEDSFSFALLCPEFADAFLVKLVRVVSEVTAFVFNGGNSSVG